MAAKSLVYGSSRFTMRVRGIAGVATEGHFDVSEHDEPARDVEIPFGQHKGKPLGALPEGYLKVLARMARTKWACLAEEVLNERGVVSGGKHNLGSIMEQDAYMRLLRNASSLQQVELVHSRIAESEQHKHNVDLINEVICTYAKYGSIVQVKQVFDGMLYQNEQSWNVMISAYAQNGHLMEAKSVFDEMPARNLTTWISILKAYTDNADFSSWEAARTVFQKMAMHDVESANLIISSPKSSEECKLIFDSMLERDVGTYNSMLQAYASDGHSQEAEATFNRMPGWNVLSGNIMLEVYGLNGHIDKAKEMFEVFPERNEETMSVMVRAYGSVGHADEARGIFDRMLKKDEELANIVLRAYALSGHTREAKFMFDMIPNKSSLSWASLLEGYVQNLELDNAELMFDKMPEWSARSWIAIIWAYAQCGHEQMARIMFNRISDWDPGAWEAFIAGLVLLGRGRDAIQLLRGMNLEGFHPDEVAFLRLLEACSNVDEGIEFFTSMIMDYSLSPWREHYAAMVGILGRAKQLDNAESLVNSMPFEPEFDTWKAILQACKQHRDVKRGVQTAKKLITMHPKEACTYILLAALYMAVDKQDKVKVVRGLMEKQQVREQGTGESLILVKDKLHRFIDGDVGHPESGEICNQLQELRCQVQEAGYGIRGDGTEGICGDLWDHSEKIAVAYGIMKTRKRCEVRVVSRLRVCEDCHTVMKLVSKVTERLLVLRDETRVHHFDKGQCSCKDYW